MKITVAYPVSSTYRRVFGESGRRAGLWWTV